MSALEFQINLSGNFTSNLEQGNAALGNTEERARRASKEFELFESEIGKASGSLGGFGFNLDAIAKGGSLFVFDLAEAAKDVGEAFGAAIEKVIDLGKEIIKVAGDSQDLDLAIKLDVGDEGSAKINKLAEGFALTSRFSGEQIKKSLLPLIEQGGIGDEKQLSDIATAATDIAARRNTGIGGVQSAIAAFQKIALKREVSPKMLQELAINEKDFYTDLGGLLGVSAAQAEKATKDGKVKSQTLLSIALNQVAQREGGALGAATIASGNTLGGTLEKLANLKDDMFRKLADSPGMKILQDRLESFIGAMKGPIGEKLMNTMERVFVGVGNLFKPEKIESFFKVVGVGIDTVKTAFDVLWPVVKIATGYFAAYGVAMLGYNIYTGIATVATMGFTGALGALRIAILANPIGLIAAGLLAVGFVAYEVYEHWNGIKDFFFSIGQSIGAAFDWVWQKVTGVFNSITDAGATFIGWAANLATSLWDSMVGVGTRIWQGLRDGILGGITAVGDAIGSLGDSVVSGLKGVLGIHSPSAVMAELGGFTAEGFSLGIEDGAERTRSAAAASLSDAAIDGGTSSLSGGNVGGTVFTSSITVNVNGAGQGNEEIGHEVAQSVRVELERFLYESSVSMGVAA